MYEDDCRHCTIWLVRSLTCCPHQLPGGLAPMLLGLDIMTLCNDALSSDYYLCAFCLLMCVVFAVMGQCNTWNLTYTGRGPDQWITFSEARKTYLLAGLMLVYRNILSSLFPSHYASLHFSLNLGRFCRVQSLCSTTCGCTHLETGNMIWASTGNCSISFLFLFLLQRVLV